MKTNTKVSNIWTTTANAASRNAAKPNAHLSKSNGTRTVKPWTSTGSSAAMKSKDNPPVKDTGKGKITLVDLEEELERERGKLSLVDQEAKTKEVSAKTSWADIVRDHQFQSKAFSETVSMQGLAPIFDPRSSLKRKLVWCTIVVVAIIFTAFNIYTQICMYAGKPITVRVDFRKAKDTEFPTITLCNNNFASYASAVSFRAATTLKMVKPLLFTNENTSEPDFSTYDFSPYRVSGWEVFYKGLAQNMRQMLLRVCATHLFVDSINPTHALKRCCSWYVQLTCLSTRLTLPMLLRDAAQSMCSLLNIIACRLS